MSPRTGRPKLENPISICTSVRLDAKTMRELEEYCKRNGIAKCAAIRKGVLLLLESDKK